MDALRSSLGKGWVDGSYSNDSMASIYLDAPDPTKEDPLIIFIPNAPEEDLDAEEYDCYYITRDGDTLGEFAVGQEPKLIARIAELTK